MSSTSPDQLNFLNKQNSDEKCNDLLIKNLNIFYKGWILTYQDLSNDISGDLSSINSVLADNNLKWVPKFAVVNKQEKCVLLYDSEPSNDTLANHFQLVSLNLDNINTNQEITYRLDNSVNQELFLNYWRNRLSKFDLNLNERTNLSKDENYLLNKSYNFHHLSNKDIELLEKETLNKTNNNIESSSTSANGTFRFAGLFFKRDKTEKVKHSSLKRAKSGIQLERNKKPVLNNSSNSTILNDKQAKSNFINQTNIDFDSRHSLPSPMRPSRSHESLSSPVKPTINIEQADLKKTSHFNRINQFLASNRSKQQVQTPSIKNKINQSQMNQNYLLQYQLVDNLIRLNLNQDQQAVNNKNSTPSKSPKSLNDQQNFHHQILINSIHNSIFNEENCFEVKCLNNNIKILNPISNTKNRGTDKGDSSEIEPDIDDEFGSSRSDSNRTSRRDTLEPNQLKPKLKYDISTINFSSRYFMCRSAEERDRWLHCLRDVSQPNLLYQRHDENSLQVWILEAKGQAISSKPNKKFFCEIYLNNTLYARSCSKDKRDILFWGENFDFNNVRCDYLRVELYQHTIETQKKKSKKEKDKDGSSSARDKDSGKESVTNTHPSNQILLGYVNIPVSSIESSQSVEKWYKLEAPSSDFNLIHSDQSSTGTATSIGSNSSSASFTTTQNFSKDSISIRIKAKYLSVDILPLNCYNRLIEFIRVKYLNLITLEPHLNVRIKDDLANSLVRIAHKLQIQTKFLTDLVLAEVLQLEDNSLTFRGNSLATKAMESYMKLVGENYLKHTLSDCVRSIIETNHDLEIDPSKVSNQSSLQANREELVQILHLVCGRVFNSCVNFPIEMKHVFACLRAECKKNGKTDEMCDTLISASIFLRFICPAILSPNLFNLTQEYPQEKAARKLTLAAKTLQTIANFSKFGGKEFYMSFEKMNLFVDEHTALMREFLRNISTLTEDEEFELNTKSNTTNKQILPILTLTPQTPQISKKTIILSQNESNIDLELTDLGKQLSILHTLLTSIVAGLDEQTKSKFDNELNDILNDITNIKKNPIILNDFLNQNINSINTVQNNNSHNNNNNNKLYSYENRLHFAVMKNQQQQQQQQQMMQSNSPITPSTPSESAVQSLNSSGEKFNSINNQISSSSSSSRYSSQITLNIHNNFNENNLNNLKLNQNQDIPHKNLESEINLLKQKLKETELSLKKEQTEKYLIEYKLKQQQQDNDQQMRNIINRLIKVEEELRKEQGEMHKLLKAKQDLIDIQKKRIEYLSNRSINGSVTMNKSTQYSNNYNLLSNLPLNHPSTNYNQHSYHPKLRQLNKTQLKPVISSSNPSINENGPSNHLTPVLSSQLPISKLNEKNLIAASPSSSSSSMTQFCSYLASNNNNNQTQSINKLNKVSAKNSNASDHPHITTSVSTSSNLSTIHSQNQLNGQNTNSFLRASEL